MNATRRTVVLDIRHTLPPGIRYRFLSLFDSLKVGDTLKVLIDRDPRPLRYQLILERRGEFAWEARQEATEEWVAWIRKVR